MSGNRRCSVYIGNLDERVSERVLYDIMIQAGPVVDLYIPRDKETNKSKGFAFAEYETQESADYAVKLFTGLVTLCNRTLKFAISGQDRPSTGNPSTNMPNSSSWRPSSVSAPNMESSPGSFRSRVAHRSSAYPEDYSEVPPPPGVEHRSSGSGSRFESNDYGYSRRVFGATLDTMSQSRYHRNDTSYSNSRRYK